MGHPRGRGETNGGKKTRKKTDKDLSKNPQLSYEKLFCLPGF